MPYQPIENYGAIGDLYTVALVGMDGSIDFLAWPHFDSPTIFAALLDDERGGRFSLAPVLGEAQRKQLYFPDTNVLFTRFLSPAGVAEVSDFMPVEDVGVAHNLVRRARTVRGEVRFRMVCAPRFDYGRASHRVELRPGEAVFASDGPDRTVLRLRTPVPLEIQDGAAVAELTLGAGETAAFVLEDGSLGSDSPSSSPSYVSAAFLNTVEFWRRWVSRSTYRGRWREMVNRSALTLKMLTSAAHGSIVASPTFGIPEQIGGVRNWDYRYTWIRDAAFTLYALFRLGYADEARAFMRWFEPRFRESTPVGPLQVAYRLNGGREIREELLPHLSGYRGSRPVRIGNSAALQLQLDVYGELLDALYLYDKYGEPISYDLWRDVVRLVDWVCENWERPDEGIWEIRGPRQEFLFSRFMCWIAVDRAIRLAHKRSFPAPLARWYGLRDKIYEDVFQSFWSEERRAFVQHKHGLELDASTLLMPLVHFIAPTDPRFSSTLRAIQAELLDDSLVYRYRIGRAASDGIAGSEGTFCMCSFWLVECLSRAGDIDLARLYFEKMLGYANHLGLYAEELGPSGEHLGNFPQAFTHVTLISAAFHLDRRLSEAGRPG